MKIPRMFWAGLTVWATTGVLGVTALAAPAHAATTTPRAALAYGYDLTGQAGLLETHISTPTGLEPAIFSQILFTVHYQPLAGSMDMYLQEKTKSGWFNALHAPRVTFPLNPPVGGFAMFPGNYLCSGTNNYWRIALLIHAESHTGNWQGPVTYYFTNGQTTPNGAGGQRINCT